jgi:predicted metalloprotease with PDZ domain
MKSLPAFAALLSASTLIPFAAPAQQAVPRAQPEATALPPAIPDARDVPYPGTIDLVIDASDTGRGLYRVTETIPVPRGETAMTLLLPSWLPGNHAPRGPINLMADVHFEADGKPLGWRRDPVAVNAFHLDLPEGTRAVTARFIHTSPIASGEGRITMTPEMLNLQWEKMSLYPAGYYVRQVKVKPTVKFPEGWTVFTALDGQRGSGTVTWAATDYETLVDSPVFAGEHAKRWDLGKDVYLDAVADAPKYLALKDEHLQTYRNLVTQSLYTFGARHFDHYDFLLALSDRLGGIGLEHHRSSENRYTPEAFTEWEKYDWARNVIAHEFVHSWNGKYRRPADLWTPDYQQPMRDSLLWVYEGQTQFWGYVLAARSGIQTTQTIIDTLASRAATYAEGQPGRQWRSVADTTNDPIINSRRPLPYGSLSRSEDYYTEGAFVWLEADQIIRKGTGGAKGLDDFARRFFGINDGDWGQATYKFEDVVADLTAVYPYDWDGFLQTRLYAANQPAPLNGLTMGGYRLVWKDEPNSYDKGRMAQGKYLDLTYSLGVQVGRDGVVSGVLWDSPAFDAGIVTGTKIVGVGGKTYSDDTMRETIAAAKGGREPLSLVVQRGERVMTVAVPYDGGLRYPWLESTTPGKPAPLDRLLAPRRK